MNCMCVLTNCTNGGTHTLSKYLYGTSVNVYSVCSVLSQVSAYISEGNKWLPDYYVYACSPLDFVPMGGLIHLIRLITLCTVHIVYYVTVCLFLLLLR